jgi:nucleoside phosphorylase/tetratricopeptide (TPR) repeat protein
MLDMRYDALVTSTSDQLRALLDETVFRVLESLASAVSPVSGRAVARALNISPTTALAALALLQKAGFATSETVGRSSLWRLNNRNPTVLQWLNESSGKAGVDVREPRPRLKVVIFTALGLEYAAVAAYLPARRPERIDGTRFESDVFVGDHVDWIVYIAEVGVGNVRTAVEVTSAIKDLAPDLVLFVGVAGSVKPKDLCRGDVVVADRVYNLHSGKDAWSETDGSVHLERSVSFTATHRAIQFVMKVRRSDWVLRFAADARNVKGESPTVEIKPIAAGEVVHGDNQSLLMEKVRDHFNDVAAVDMESLGLYEAAHVKERPALSVRGISDCVGDKKPDLDVQWQPRAAKHAAAFAFALLSHAELDDFPRLRTEALLIPQNVGGQSSMELLLCLPPPVAVAFEWALPITGDRAIDALGEIAGLGGQPATWLSRFRHRPPALFQGEGSEALWVLVAQFADSHEHPTASWLYEQAAQRSKDAILSAYMYCRGAVAASRNVDPGDPDELLERAAATAPAGRLLWAYFDAAIHDDVSAVLAATPAIADSLGLVFPQPVQQALGEPAESEQPDESLMGFVGDFAERYPAFLEQTRLTVALATANAVRAKPGRISAAQLLLEALMGGLPAYRGSHAGAFAWLALAGSRSSNIPLELARTLCMRAADSSGQDMSFDRDAALARAEDLAQTARDRLQDWGGPTSDALAVAAQARAALGDTRGALRLLLPPPAGTAGPAEAISQPVVRLAAELAVGTENIELALSLAARINDSTERKLATALALTLRKDSYPEAVAEYRSVLTEPAPPLEPDQEIRALLGLSMVTRLSDSELSRLAQLDAELADLIRAQSLLTAGQISQAQILARRYPDSDGALQIRVNCLLSQGKTADAIIALERYAIRRSDERFSVQAALLAYSSGANDEASRIAGHLASSNDPARRRIAREILIDVASRRGDWESVLVEADRLIGDDVVTEADPARDASLIKYRWSQAHALHQLRRMDEAYQVIRESPRLVPADLGQARLVASVLRTIAPSVKPSPSDATTEPGITQREVLAAVTEAAQAFPHDEELVAAAVMTAFSMPSTDPPDYGLMTKARQLHQQFFDRFPDSRLIRAIPVDDALTGVKEILRAQLEPSAEVMVQMQRQVISGQIPLSVCISAFGRNYAEALICDKVGCYVIRYPDDRVFAQEAEAARKALNGTVVVDTSSLFLAPVILGSATELREHFEQLLVAAPQRDDILQAQVSLMMRSPGSLGWDPFTKRPTFEKNDPEVTERWVTDAGRLATALGSCDVVPDPPPPGEDDPRHRLWSSPIWVARERSVSLVADDAALRAVAWNEGVPAFGSLHLLSVLIEGGVLPPNALEDCYQRLMEIRVADLPLLDRLLDIAADEGWRPGGYASFLLQRPATWMPLAGGWQKYTTLITALPEKKPEDLAGWCAAALYGLCLVTAAPTVSAVAAALVVWTLLEVRDPAALPPLLVGTERVVGQFVRGADLIEGVVQRLAMTVRQVTSPEMVGPVVLRLLSGLDGETHAAAIKHFFTMP